RGRHLELDQDRVFVHGFGAFDKHLHIDTPAHLRAEVFQRREGVGDILGGKVYAVTPLDALARLDGQLGAVFIVLVALGQPQQLLVRKGAIKGQWFIDDVWPILVIGAYRIGVPQFIINVL